MRDGRVSRARRLLLTGLAAAMLLPAGAALAQPASLRTSAYSFSFEAIDGGKLDLAAFRGRPVLVVNTATRCGFAHQLNGLQSLWQRYRDRGLTVIGVPANDFAGQEPGSNAEILGVCSQTFGVSFPLAAKQVVIGDEAHPFYRWAATQRPTETPRWNFHKYLIGRDGRIAAVFPTSIDPTDARVLTAIERVLTSPGA